MKVSTSMRPVGFLLNFIRKVGQWLFETLAKVRRILGSGRKLRPKVVRRWRLVDLGEGVGMYCFFDPARERIFIYPLTEDESPGMMESMVSVSGLETGNGIAPHQFNLFRKELDGQT